MQHENIHDSENTTSFYPNKHNDLISYITFGIETPSFLRIQRHSYPKIKRKKPKKPFHQSELVYNAESHLHHKLHTSKTRFATQLPTVISFNYGHAESAIHLLLHFTFSILSSAFFFGFHRHLSAVCYCRAETSTGPPVAGTETPAFFVGNRLFCQHEAPISSEHMPRIENEVELCTFVQRVQFSTRCNGWSSLN